MKSQIIMVLMNRLVRIQIIIFLSIVLIFSMFRLYELNHQYQLMNEFTQINIKIHEQYKNSLLMDSKMSQRELHEDEQLFVEIDNAYIDAGNAFQNRDYRKYIQLMIKAWELEDSIREKYRITITNKNTLGSTASKNGILFKKQTQQSMLHYQQLEDKNFDDKKVVNELIGITAVQSFLPILDFKIPNIFFLPFLFLFTLVMSNAIFLSDSKHRSLLNAKPISNFRYSFQKMISQWIIISFVEFVAFLFYFGVISIKNGIGDLTLKTVIFEFDKPITISYLSLFLIFISFVLLLNLFIVSLCSLLNQLFSNQILTFLFGTIVIFLETLMKVLNVEIPYIGFIPSSYFSFGTVIYGVKDEFYLNGHFSIFQGVLVLVITSVIFFILSIGILTLKERRERYEKIFLN